MDQFSKAEDAREADAWRLVLEARVALRRFDDGLRAAEAAMVICLEYGDETGQVRGPPRFQSIKPWNSKGPRCVEIQQSVPKNPP